MHLLFLWHLSCPFKQISSSSQSSSSSPPPQSGWPLQRNDSSIQTPVSQMKESQLVHSTNFDEIRKLFEKVNLPQ